MNDAVPASPGPTSAESEWLLFHGDGRQQHRKSMPPAPPWRTFSNVEPPTDDRREFKKPTYIIGPEEIDVVNAALHLRRPLLVTGHPGTGKSSLARAIADELGLGAVLHWPVNSRSSLSEALYRYDAIGRLQERTSRTTVPKSTSRQPGRSRRTVADDIGTYIRLGPVGTALVPSKLPRVLLIDEFDKGDIDLPNDLLTVFEDGAFEINELSRLPDRVETVSVLTADPRSRVDVRRGRIHCTEFPIVVITSNGERDFPPAFRRRCLPLYLPEPGSDRLKDIIEAHLGPEAAAAANDIVTAFLSRRDSGELATDQLLNAVFLRCGGTTLDAEKLLRVVLHRLSGVV